MIDSEQVPFYMFLHIPKTAGTTLRSIVDQNLGAENVLTYYNQNSRQLLDNLDAHLKFKPNYRAIIGHFKFGLHQLIDRPSTYITFLRHPVARTISQYKEHYVNHRYHLEDADGNILSLAGSVKNNPSLYANYQTGFLIGDEVSDLSDVANAELALKNLDSCFAVVGLVEYFDQSLALMSNLLKWQVDEIQQLNVKDIEVEVTPDLIEEIEAINSSDLIIYEAIKSKLLEEFEITP
tara:strand:- start:2208 stop:2915 length:708 start_codon:yes stop_codon:yes gene_type:complete